MLCCESRAGGQLQNIKMLLRANNLYTFHHLNSYMSINKGVHKGQFKCGNSLLTNVILTALANDCLSVLPGVNITIRLVHLCRSPEP